MTHSRVAAHLGPYALPAALERGAGDRAVRALAPGAAPHEPAP